MTSGRESSEDYLEAILVIRREHGWCRNVDIAERQGSRSGGNTTSSSVEGNGHRAIAAESRNSEMQRLPLRKEQSMTAESAGSPYVKVPLPIQDT